MATLQLQMAVIECDPEARMRAGEEGRAPWAGSKGRVFAATAKPKTVTPSSLSERQAQLIKSLDDMRMLGRIAQGGEGGVNTCHIIITVTVRQQIRRTLSRQVNWTTNLTIHGPT